ncbi:MAG: glycosyltransferase family 4 protein [Acidobacteriota bacterium]|nr:MAG: glycosyltransferase family 4 protein [Acidobacteriota bacterium]
MRRRRRSDGRSLHFEDGRYRVLGLDQSLAQGCNLIGYAFAEFGIGEHLRLVAQALLDAGLPLAVINQNDTIHRQEERLLSDHVQETNPYKTNIICYNNSLVSQWYFSGNRLLEGRYNIGYGYWELSEYPDEWLYAMNLLDEIWAPSRFVQEVISRKSSLPVVHMPIPVQFRPSRTFRREDFGLPERKLIFLSVFDLTAFHRKNPGAAINSFRKAFPLGSEPVELVLKTKSNESEADKRNLQELEEMIASDPRIRLINAYFTKDEVLGLISVSDCLLSLHRSEGFGLPIAEAMGMGKTVIATAYSGNMDFMNRQNSFPIQYELVDVKPGQYFNLEGTSVWAEPDGEEAAACMGEILRDPESFRRAASLAAEEIQMYYNLEVIGGRYRSRLELIGLIEPF